MLRECAAELTPSLTEFLECRFLVVAPSAYSLAAEKSTRDRMTHIISKFKGISYLMMSLFSNYSESFFVTVLPCMQSSCIYLPE